MDPEMDQKMSSAIPTPLSSLHCSDVFYKALLGVDPEVKVGTSAVVDLEQREQDQEGEKEENEEDDLYGGTKIGVPDAARRAWGKIRLYVAEETMKKNSKESTLGWTFLHRTVPATFASNLEKVRKDLYDRYLVRPDSWTDALINCPDQLRHKYERQRLANERRRELGLLGQGQGQYQSLLLSDKGRHPNTSKHTTNKTRLAHQGKRPDNSGHGPQS